MTEVTVYIGPQLLDHVQRYCSRCPAGLILVFAALFILADIDVPMCTLSAVSANAMEIGANQPETACKVPRCVLP